MRWWPWAAPDGRPYIPATERERVEADLMPVSKWLEEGLP
jgi:hypothetical protein